jgi:putative tricarboxylic transport membrane protein
LKGESRKEVEMKKYQLCAAVFWVALGLFVSFYSYRLGLGSITNPGPGLYPFCLGIVFLAIALIVLTQIVIKAGEHETEKEKQPANLSKVIAVLVVLFAYALLLEVLGYQLTTFAALAVLFRIGGLKKVIQILGYSAAIVIITYLLFTYLGVQFPPGVFRLLGLG